MVDIFDDFFTEQDHHSLLEYCEKSSYTYGEFDTEGTPPTGLVHEITDREIYSLIEDTINQTDEYFLYRMYVNCFAPGEMAYFHTDGEEGDVTFIYYPNKVWKPDDGGETQIYEGDLIKGVPPKPNRMLKFDASLLHRATPFRDRHRFTIAIKYAMINRKNRNFINGAALL